MFYNEYKRKKRVKKTVIGLSILIILSVFLYLGYNSMKSETVSVIPSKQQVNADIITKGTYKITHHYTCGHSEVTEEKIPFEFIGRSVEDVISTNAEFNSLTYDDNCLNADINETVKCDQHYRIKLNDNDLYVFCEKYPQKPLKKIKINLKGMYEDEVELLKSGIEFGSQNAMLEFLEDFES